VKSFVRWVAAILVVLTNCTAWGQSPTNLRDAVETAVLQNPDVKLRYHNLLAALQERRAGEGGWYPKVDLEATTGSYQTQSPSIPNAMSYPGNRTVLQLRQMLFDGFATRQEVRRLSYSQLATYYDLVAATNQTSLEVARAYIDVLRFREFVNLATDNYTNHLEVHDKLAQKVKAGVGRRVDLEQASGRLALAESNWLTEVSNLHDVSARYQRLVGDIPAETLTPLDAVDEYLPIGSDFLSEAVRTSPEFMAAVATIRAYRADSVTRKSANYPTLEFRARQTYETNQQGVVGEYRDTAVELVLNYNLYRGGSDSARIKQYLAKLDSAFDLRDKACRDGWQTGQIAFNDSIRIANQLKLLAQHELSTSKAQQAYQQQFDIGQRSLLDLLDTQNELYQSRRALAGGEYDLQLAQIRVLATSGELLKAIKVRTLAPEKPDVAGGADKEDDLMQCSDRILPALTLNRSLPVSQTPDLKLQDPARK
jgi:adhesin transport system outer membrane protein